MEQNKRLDYLIQYLINEDKQYYEIAIPKSTDEKKRILRSLMNVREPLPISREFLKIQDEYLQEELKRKKNNFYPRFNTTKTSIIFMER